MTVTITETDTARVTISPTELTVEEGGLRETYIVALTNEPTANVTVTVGGHANTDLQVVSPSLTFSPSDWTVSRAFTIYAVSDADAADDAPVTLTHTVTGAVEYAGITVDPVTVTITETDTAGVAISKTALTLVEGESGDYTLELTSEPTATVTVTLGGHASTNVSVSPASLTFNAANWNTAGTVTVTANHDSDLTDEFAVTLSHAVSGTGEYAGITAGSVTVNITDDDNPVSIAADAASVVEGVAATFTLIRTGYLAQARTVNVALTEIGGWGYIQGTGPTTVQFAANANTTTLTVNTNDDKVVGNSGSVTAALEPGANYVAVPPDSATVNMTDNDTAGDVAWELMVSPDTITEGEAGTTVTLSITNGYTFAQPQTVRLFWLGLDVDSLSLLEGQGGTGAITIAAGASSGSRVLIGSDTDLYDFDDGQLTSPLEAKLDGTQIGDPVDLTLVDDEPPPVVTLTASANEIVEGDTITLTATASPRWAAAHGIDITYTDSGGVVTSTVPTILHFAGGQSELDLTITTDDDLVDEPNAEVTFTLSNPEYPVTLGAPSSVTVRVRDDDVKPGAPQSFNAVAGDTVVDLTWQTGDSGSEPITKYQYRVSGDGGDNWNPDWGDIPGSGAGTTSYQVTGLRNDAGYLFQIRAVNIVGEGALARKGSGAYSTLVSAIINGREYLAPSDFRYQRDLEFDTGSLVVAAEYLEWRAPAWWWSAGDTCCPDTELSRYEIQRRTRATWSSWSEWEDIHDLDIYELHNENRRENGAIARYWLVNYPETGAPFCRQYQWRVRAIYFEPARHSQWVVANHNRMPEARVPLRPKPNRQDQSFQETSENAYSLTFVWPTAQAPCYPDTQYQVQRRSFVGSWYGYNPPADGAALSNGAIYDENTMTIEGNRVWKHWVEAGAFSGSTRQYTHTFNGRTNHQLRVRAENAYGWGPWSQPWLFTIDLSPNSQYWTDIY